jgi:hypothetical protein
MILAFIAMILCSSCVFWGPVAKIRYNGESLSDEKALGYNWSDYERKMYSKAGVNVDKIRRAENAVLYGALIGISIIRSQTNVDHVYPPFSIVLEVRGLPDYHTSFTVKSINIKTDGGEYLSNLENAELGDGLSNLANTGLPVTVILESKSHKNIFVSKLNKYTISGSYCTEHIFAFTEYRVWSNDNEKPVTVTVTLEIHGVDGSETGDIVFEFSPVVVVKNNQTDEKTRTVRK